MTARRKTVRTAAAHAKGKATEPPKRKEALEVLGKLPDIAAITNAIQRTEKALADRLRHALDVELVTTRDGQAKTPVRRAASADREILAAVEAAHGKDAPNPFDWLDAHPDLVRARFGDPLFLFVNVVGHGMPALLDAAMSLLEPGALDAQGISTLSVVGNAVSAAIRRQVLLASLMTSSWNMSRCSESLRMGGSANVLRAIRDLGLEPEYEAAKARGLVRQGGRTKAQRSAP